MKNIYQSRIELVEKEMDVLKSKRDKLQKHYFHSVGRFQIRAGLGNCYRIGSTYMKIIRFREREKRIDVVCIETKGRYKGLSVSDYYVWNGSIPFENHSSYKKISKKKYEKAFKKVINHYK